MQETDPATDPLDGLTAFSSAQDRPTPAPLDDLAARLNVPPMRADDTCVVMWESEPTRAFHTWVNKRAEELLGFPRQRWQTEPDFWAERLHPHDRDRTHRAFHQALAAHGRCQQTYRLLHADGSIRWVQEHVNTVDYPASEDGLAPRRLRGTMIDVTDYHREIDALERSRAYYRALFEDAPAIYFVLDEHGVVKRINQRGADQLSYTPSQLVDQPFLHLQAGTDVIDITRLILDSDGTQDDWHNTTLRCGDNTLLPVRLRACAEAPEVLEDMELAAPALLVSCEPLPTATTSAQESAEDAVDALTGLCKRAAFERQLQHLLYRHYEQPGQHVLALIDIDQFGLANYRFGQSAGDTLLREVAEILQDHMRRGDLIGRTGSDEFAVLLERCSMRQAKVLCEGAIDAISQHEFEWADHSVRLTASAGLVKIDANLQSVSELMSAADAARREASAEQLSGLRLVDPAAAPSVHRNSDVALAAELQNALEDRRLELFYQPIRQLYNDSGPRTASAGDGPPTHYELLLRVRRNQLLMSPLQILMAAERHHLISDVDRWVLTEATRWLEHRPAHVVAGEICCINVSAKSICDKSFIDFARNRLRALGDRASSICFEITETAIIGNLDDAVAGMERLRSTGCEFSLDDFGSGSASFPYLRKLPVSYLKIDGSFVREAGASDEDARFLELINQIGHHAGKQTVAEFVENEQTLSRVRDIGLDFAQGYEIGRPRPLEHFGIAVTASPPAVAAHGSTVTPFPNVRSV